MGPKPHCESQSVMLTWQQVSIWLYTSMSTFDTSHPYTTPLALPLHQARLCEAATSEAQLAVAEDGTAGSMALQVRA